MSYKCKTCRAIVPAGKPRLVHLVKRKDGSIVRELAVCETCRAFLAAGTPASSLASTPQPAESAASATPVPSTRQTSSNSKLVPTGD